MKRNRGFSLVELAIGILFLSWTIMSYLALTRASNQSAMNAYFEFLAFQAAQEPLEVFHSFGYRWLNETCLKTGASPLESFPIKVWHDINQGGSPQYPAEIDSFKRLIEIQPVQNSNISGIQVIVTVAPREQTRAMSWLVGKKNVSLSTVIFEQPK